MTSPLASLLRLPRSAWLFGTELLRHALFVLAERVAPVQRGRWAFATWPGRYAHTLDNPRAVFEEVKNDPSIEKVILRKRGQDPSTVIPEGVNVRFVDVESLEGAWLLATCEVLLTGYALASLCSYAKWLTRKHQIIQLWHGIPLKRIGKLFPGEHHWDRETHKYAATVCSSEADQQIMAAAFAPLPLERTWLTGLPRNDLLLKPEHELPADYQRELQRLRTALAGRHLVLYAPTWRDAKSGMYDFSDAEWQLLEQVLIRHNAVFGIRAHSNRRSAQSSQEGAQTLMLNDYPDVSMLLRETAVLITDYSSIYIDFMLARRPSLFFSYDLESYQSERGFLYPYDDATPSTPIEALPDLVLAIETALTRGLQEEWKFRAVFNRFHGHEGQASNHIAARIRCLV